jgi:hypothetical protein
MMPRIEPVNARKKNGRKSSCSKCKNKRVSYSFKFMNLLRDKARRKDEEENSGRNG